MAGYCSQIWSDILPWSSKLMVVKPVHPHSKAKLCEAITGSGRINFLNKDAITCLINSIRAMSLIILINGKVLEKVVTRFMVIFLLLPY
jgi:hypothetical protein